jgi:hypothetical protein
LLKHLLVVGLALGGVIAQASPDYSVDLVTSPRSTEVQYEAVSEIERVRVEPARPWALHSPPPVLPFELAGVTFDRTDYRLGDGFVYECTLRYTGTTPFTFPVSSEVHRFRRTMDGLRMASLAIRFEDALLGRQTPDIETLYGSPEVPGSLITFAPNQTLKVRASGIWRLQEAQTMPQGGWSRQILPAVALRMQFTLEQYQETRSESVPTIQLVREP